MFVLNLEFLVFETTYDMNVVHGNGLHERQGHHVAKPSGEMTSSLIGVVFLSMQDLFGSPEWRRPLPHPPRYDNRLRRETAWKEAGGTAQNVRYVFQQTSEATRYQKIGIPESSSLCPFLGIHRNGTLPSNLAWPIQESLSSFDRIPDVFFRLIPVDKLVFAIPYSLFSFLQNLFMPRRRREIGHSPTEVFPEHFHCPEFFLGGHFF